MSKPTRENGLLLVEARRWAGEYGLNFELVCALCEVESGWIPVAQRHEAGYEWLVGFKAVPLAVLLDGGLDEKTLFRDAAARTWQADPKRLARFGGVVIGDRATILTELLNQQTSVGLTQPMFSTMRERGFRGRFAEMFDPATNLKWGCRHLRWMIDHNNAYGLPDFRIKPADLAAAWNWGSRETVDCPECSGSGDKVYFHHPEDRFPDRDPCEYCHGTGRAYKNQPYVDKVLAAMVNYE